MSFHCFMVFIISKPPHSLQFYSSSLPLLLERFSVLENIIFVIHCFSCCCSESSRFLATANPTQKLNSSLRCQGLQTRTLVPLLPSLPFFNCFYIFVLSSLSLSYWSLHLLKFGIIQVSTSG